MTDTPKLELLTEAEWRDLLSLHPLATKEIAALRERGLIAEEPVDSDLIEARKLACEFSETWPHDEIMAGCKDETSAIRHLYQALRRGREIEREAASPLTRERVREAMLKVWGDVSPWADAYASDFHAALTGGQP